MIGCLCLHAKTNVKLIGSGSNSGNGCLAKGDFLILPQNLKRNHQQKPKLLQSIFITEICKYGVLRRISFKKCFVNHL